MPTKSKEKLKKSSVKPADKPKKPRESVVAQALLPLNESDEDEQHLNELIAASDQAAGVKEKYYESVGRRKESVARVRLMTKKSSDEAKEDKAILTINGKDYIDYFRDTNLLARIEAPLRKLKSLNRFKATVMVHGGGIAGQAGAVRHGIARALEKFDANFRKKLKKAGFLTRDPRVKERRKYGHKKARKSGRWSKR